MKILYSIPLLFAISMGSYAQTCVTSTASIEVNEVVPSGTGNWTPLTNAALSDDNRDQASISSQGFSNRLKLTNFGFTLPNNISIQGISATVERSVSSSVVFRDQDIMLVKGNVTQTTTNKATLVNWPAADGIANYGGATDLWGNTWTRADIISSGFGIALSAFRTVNAGAPSNARIDFVSITVCYINTLPLKINSFSVTKNGNKNALIEWITSNEQNVKELQVEKSMNGADFILLKPVIPKGNNTAGENKYSLQDNLVLNGTNYYRLKIVDTDGNYHYSEIKPVTFTNIESNIAINYINKALKIGIINTPGKYELAVFDLAGRKLFSQNIATRLNNDFITVPLSLQPNQIVIISLKGNGLLIQKKFFL